MEINNIRQASNYEDYFFKVKTPESPHGVFPVVTCHLNDSGGPMASISYFRFNEVIHTIPVTVGRFDPQVVNPIVSWYNLTPAASGWVVLDHYLLFQVIQSSDIVTISGNPNWDNAYWMGWCEWIDGFSEEVHVAFGDTT